MKNLITNKREVKNLNNLKSFKEEINNNYIKTKSEKFIYTFKKKKKTTNKNKKRKFIKK